MTLDPTGEMTLNMVNVYLPLPPTLQPRAAVVEKMRQKMLIGANIFTIVFFLEETGWWTRCSAQVFTEVGDFEKLGEVLLKVCAEVVHELDAEKETLKSKL